MEALPLYYKVYLNFAKILALKKYRLRETFAAVCAPMPTSCSPQLIYESGCYANRIVDDELQYQSSLVEALAEYYAYQFKKKGRDSESTDLASTSGHMTPSITKSITQQAQSTSTMSSEKSSSAELPSTPKQPIRTTWESIRRQVRKCDHFVVALHAASNWADYFDLLVLFNRSIPFFVLFKSIFSLLSDILVRVWDSLLKILYCHGG